MGLQKNQLEDKLKTQEIKINFLEEQNKIKTEYSLNSNKILEKYKQSNSNLQKILNDKIISKYLISDNYLDILVKLLNSAQRSTVSSEQISKLKKSHQDEIYILWGIIVDLNNEKMISCNGQKNQYLDQIANEKYNFIDDLLNLTADLY